MTSAKRSASCTDTGSISVESIVRSPSGRVAIVVSMDRDEATVQFLSDGERATLRLKHLTLLE